MVLQEIKQNGIAKVNHSDQDHGLLIIQGSTVSLSICKNCLQLSNFLKFFSGQWPSAISDFFSYSRISSLFNLSPWFGLATLHSLVSRERKQDGIAKVNHSDQDQGLLIIQSSAVSLSICSYLTFWSSALGDGLQLSDFLYSRISSLFNLSPWFRPATLYSHSEVN